MSLIVKTCLCDQGAGKGDVLTTDLEQDRSTSSKGGPRKNKYSMSSIRCFGVDLTPDNIAVAMVYFVQGVLGLSRLAVSFYLKDDLHLDPAEVCCLDMLKSQYHHDWIFKISINDKFYSLNSWLKLYNNI